MTIQQIFVLLRSRWRIAASTAVLTVLSALVVSLVLPKQYTAGTAVVIDVKSPDPIAGLVLPGLISPSYMATQVDIVNSDRVARRVVERLRLNADPQAIGKWRDATGGEGDIVAWLAAGLKKSLEVKPSRESNVINIAGKGNDPVEVARIVNAFAQAFIDVNLELKVEPARQNALWFEEQTRIQRARLDAAQQALSSYQQKSGIVGTDEALDFETTRLNELSSQLALAQGQNAENRGKSRAVGEATADVLQNPLINNLKTDIARLESRLQESNVNLGRNHPQTQRMESELASLKARLNAEVHKISASADTTFRIGKQKEQDLAEALERQKQRVLQLNRQRDELSILKRDVESAQRDFEGVSQRSAQARLESLSVQTNAVVLNPAVAPADPSRPKLKLNLLVAGVLGSLLGIGLSLLLEFTDRRIRSADDLEYAAALPLLASIGPLPEQADGTAKTARPLPLTFARGRT